MAADSHRCLPFAVFPAIAVFLYLPHLTIGLHTPLNVRAEAVNGSDFLIISWSYQSDANYSTIHIRRYINLPGLKGHDTTSVSPTVPFCVNQRCSYCVFDVYNPQLSCHSFNPGYKTSIGIRLEFELLISYKVGACWTNETSSCLENAWQNFTFPPGPPTAVKARPFSSTSVEVTWSAPSQTKGTIEAYTVYYKAGDGQEQYKRFPTDLHKEKRGILTSLQPNTNYTIWVVASAGNKPGEMSNTTTVTTYEHECVSSPCHHNSQCKLVGDSFGCVCPEGWEGKDCKKPKKYSVYPNSCLNFDGYISFESNLTLFSCFEKCNKDSSCKSFDYGRGYNKHGSFQSDLYTKDVGQCKRWSVGKSKYGIKSCPFDYFEKEETSRGSMTVTVAQFIILLSLSGVMSVMY
ncbi:Jag1p [Porites harrisoni]